MGREFTVERLKLKVSGKEKTYHREKNESRRVRGDVGKRLKLV
jgi:hypothetical protein